MAIHILRLLDFFVYGTRPGPGNVSARAPKSRPWSSPRTVTA